jgi:hypothetical protein
MRTYADVCLWEQGALADTGDHFVTSLSRALAGAEGGVSRSVEGGGGGVVEDFVDYDSNLMAVAWGVADRCADVCWRMLWRMLACAGVCWRVLAYAGVCWRVLAYDKVC